MNTSMSTTMSSKPDLAIEAAAARVSCDGRFAYTRRNLYFEMVRSGACSDPGGAPEAAFARFDERLANHETVAPLARLVRPEQVPQTADLSELPPDVLDYTVRRVVLFERLDTCLLFVANAFHRRIECALATYRDFPGHVWAGIDAQLADDQRTTFFAVHDCSVRGYRWFERVKSGLSDCSGAKVVHVGLTFPWAFRLRLPVRTMPQPAENEREQVGNGQSERALPDDELLGGGDWRPLLQQGNYAHFEELPPLAALRWVYRFVARGAEDIGFG